MAEAPDFPITVKEFLEHVEQHLRVGDIVLTRSPSLISWLIRFATGSHFSHAALVFLVAKPEEGFNNTFLLESTRAGVGLASLREYVAGRKPRAEVVVLRLEGDGLDEAYFRKVRGLMLDHVKAGYDYSRVMRLALSLNFGARLGWSKLRAGSPASMKDAITRTRRRLYNWVPPQFICSGFIQYGYLKSAELLKREVDVVLHEGLSTTDRDGILAVTPEDLARSPRLTWLFAIRRGWVHQVASYPAAMKVISSGR